MAEGRGCLAGGILSLVDRLEDTKARRALEADLIASGLRLRWFPAPDYTWGDLLAFISGLGRESAFVRHELGDDAAWGAAGAIAGAQRGLSANPDLDEDQRRAA